jgi:hypothetical protein
VLNVIKPPRIRAALIRYAASELRTSENTPSTMFVHKGERKGRVCE